MATRTHGEGSSGLGQIHRLSLPRALLGLAAGGIAALSLIPVLYLIRRAWSVGLVEAIQVLLNPRTLQVILNSVLLAFLVTVASLLIGLPLAWLTVRTDLPWRRTWTVLGALPLAIPSYVGAYALVAMMGPRGIMQGWLEPIGVERIPSIYGLPGAAWALTLFTYP
jgi:iron(III) transport system permease protein